MRRLDVLRVVPSVRALRRRGVDLRVGSAPHWATRISLNALDVEQSTEAVYDALCRVVRAGQITYAANVAAALRDAGIREIDDGLVSRLLESLVDAGRVTSVPVRQGEEARDPPAYGLPQNSL